MGRADGPGAFDLGISEMDGCRPQAVHKLLFTSDALTERLSRFHFPTIDVVPLRSVQKTGQLKPVHRSVDPGNPGLKAALRQVPLARDQHRRREKAIGGRMGHYGVAYSATANEHGCVQQSGDGSGDPPLTVQDSEGQG